MNGSSIQPERAWQIRKNILLSCLSRRNTREEVSIPGEVNRMATAHQVAQTVPFPDQGKAFVPMLGLRDFYRERTNLNWFPRGQFMDVLEATFSQLLPLASRQYHRGSLP